MICLDTENAVLVTGKAKGGDKRQGKRENESDHGVSAE